MNWIYFFIIIIVEYFLVRTFNENSSTTHLTTLIIWTIFTVVYSVVILMTNLFNKYLDKTKIMYRVIAFPDLKKEITVGAKSQLLKDKLKLYFSEEIKEYLEKYNKAHVEVTQLHLQKDVVVFVTIKILYFSSIENPSIRRFPAKSYTAVIPKTEVKAYHLFVCSKDWIGDSKDKRCFGPVSPLATFIKEGDYIDSFKKAWYDTKTNQCFPKEVNKDFDKYLERNNNYVAVLTVPCPHCKTYH